MATKTPKPALHIVTDNPEFERTLIEFAQEQGHLTSQVNALRNWLDYRDAELAGIEIALKARVTLLTAQFMHVISGLNSDLDDVATARAAIDRAFPGPEFTATPDTAA